LKNLQDALGKDGLVQLVEETLKGSKISLKKDQQIRFNPN